MTSFNVKVKWGKELYEDVNLDTGEDPMVFKAQLFALTGVQPQRQKVMVKGAVLKDDSWDPFSKKLKNGVALLLMGSKEEDIPQAPEGSEKPQFVEDMDESQLNNALQMPAGLTNLGNTCYMNATVQCLKTVPEFKEALKEYEGRLTFDGGEAAQAITVALRDLYKSMDRGNTLPPMILLQVLHNAFPRFAERSEQGGYQQQDANECWIEMLGMIKQKLLTKKTREDVSDARSSIVDQFFGLDFHTVTRCIEAEDEPPSESTEHYLQYNCYIDKHVKYLSSGLKNRFEEKLIKRSPTLNRDAAYVKTLRVSRLPGYLTVQMVRFEFKQKDAVNAKILKDVKFPLMLDMFELCSKELQERLVPMRNKFKEHEDLMLEKQRGKPGVGKDVSMKRDKEPVNEDIHEFESYSFEEDVGSNNSGYYELQAVLTHKGRSSNSGHYVAWIRYKGDTWVECNDDEVMPVHVEDVMKLSGGGDWHTAYLLLYGPRKLPKTKDKFPAGEDSAGVKNTAEKNDEKMET